ncbi:MULTISPECIES: sigma-70 family RNA polymerase sigma factor [Enterococcus]|uniref:sigma-70 family RNA polymerase sigma factor n=1 Tax=Enterococcus TaxID=1350 RepID=UPI00287F80AA|nr:sigma-70 family RNA polymerase sigma factor [Enterococcus faecium]
MTNDRQLTYLFIRYIHQSMLNEKLNYIRLSKKKETENIHDEDLLINLQYQDERLLEQLSEKHSEVLEEYVDDIELSNAIAKLTKREKFIIYKRFVEGKKDPAIAQELSISSQAVSKQRRKALERLRQYLKSN